MRPDKLCLDVKVSSDGRNSLEYEHWKQTLTSYMGRLGTTENPLTDADKLTILTNHVSHEIFSVFRGTTGYDAVILVLDGLFIKPKNQNFSRFKLFSRKQQEGETFGQFRLALFELSKQCQFGAVSAEVHEQECVRTAFISGIRSDSIRQRLLEATQVLTDTLALADTLETAELNSKLFQSPESLLNAIHLHPTKGKTSHEVQQSCGFCGRYRHKDLAECPARGSSCSSCGKRNHWAKVCRSKQRPKLNAITDANSSQYQPPVYEYPPSSPTFSYRDRPPIPGDVCASMNPCYPSRGPPYAMPTSPTGPYQGQHFDYPPGFGPGPTPSPCAAISGPGFPPSLSDAVLRAKVNGKFDGFALIDTGSTLSFVSYNFVCKAGIVRVPCDTVITMASENHASKTLGVCEVDLVIGNTELGRCKLLVLDKLCCDVLVGHDILRKHKSLVVNFEGKLPSISVSRYKEPVHLSMAIAKIKPAPLFSNLSPDIRPIACSSRRYSEAESAFIGKTVNELIDQGLIRPSNSPWRAQVLVVDLDKPHSKPRMVVDFSRTINRYTELDAYPLPNIEESVKKMALNRIFSTYDLKSAYYQIPILESEKHYTAFEAQGKLYEWNVVPLGVTNGPPAFQRVMDWLVTVENLRGTFPYMDNISVAGPTVEEHDSNKNHFLETCSKYGLTLNEDKTVSSVRELKILGYLVSHNSIKPDPERLKPLLEMPVPNDPASLQRILGFFAYYARWVEKFSQRVGPLARNVQFPLSPDCVAAFNDIKQAIAGSCVICPNKHDPLVLESDASDFALAASLSQNGKPVAFFSRSLKLHERKHASVEKEACAIVEACRKWSHYLSGRRFKLVTDQQAVSYMFSKQNHGKLKNDKILRWRLELSTLDYEIRYRPGPLNVAADCLSRVRCAASSNGLSLAQLHNELIHPGIVRLYHYVRTHNLPYSLQDVKSVVGQCRVCAEIKPQFIRPSNPPMISAQRPFDRLSVDFKGMVPTNTRNRFMLTIIDEYSRFPWAFPCQNSDSPTVIKWLTSIFDIFGTPSSIHSDNGSAFISQEFRAFMLRKGISWSNSTKYNARGNGQCERYNGVIWKGVQLALRSRNLPLSNWELVLSEVLNTQRSLLCTATNSTPHDRLMSFARKSLRGQNLPAWLTEGTPVLLRRHARRSKYEPLVSEVELVSVEPTHARVKYPSGRVDAVSYRDIAPLPSGDVSDNKSSPGPILGESPTTSPGTVRPTVTGPPPGTFPYPGSSPGTVPTASTPETLLGQRTLEMPAVRRSTRSNMGVPPDRFEAG